MRSYPRSVFKDGFSVRVNDENEEMAKAAEGYESSKDSEIVEKRKGTDKEILRGEVLEVEELEEPEEVEIERVDPVTGEEVIPKPDDGIAERITPKKRVRRTKAQIKAAKKNGNGTR